MKTKLLLLFFFILGAVATTFGQDTTITYPVGPIATILDGDLVGADYWSDEPKILSAGLGFADIVGVLAPALTEEVVRQAGGAWLSDIDCDTTNTGPFTSTSLQQQ